MRESRAQVFIPARLREARLACGHRTEAVAVAAGVSAVTVRNWEAGRCEPRISQMAAIAALLGRSMDFFFEQGAA